MEKGARLVKTVHKYEFCLRDLERDEISEGIDIPMPVGAKPLAAACQRDPEIIAVWARVSPGVELVPHRIRVCGTGHQAPEYEPHIASIVTDGGRLVWHVFDGGER
jgi:hypothetical protein